MNEWIYRFPYISNDLPSGRKRWEPLNDLFIQNEIFLREINKFCQIVSSGINELLAKKFGINPVYVDINENANITVRDKSTNEKLGFDSMNEQIVLYIAILNAVRLVGGITYQQPFTYDKEKLLGNVEGILLEDVSSFIETHLI